MLLHCSFSLPDSHLPSVWVRVMSSGAVAIPRASQPEHLRANFEFLLSPQSLGRPVQLSEEDMQEIGQLDGILGEPWDE